MKIYANDASLPAQPVPNLNVTSALLKQQIRPFSPDDVWPEAEMAAIDLKSQGLVLQNGLEEYAKSRGGNASWLRPLLDDRFLSCRKAPPLSFNYALELDTTKWGMDPLPAFLLSLGKFFQRLASGDLPPEVGPSGPLSMDSVARMFHTRIPFPNRDLALPIQPIHPLRVAVVHKEHWFAMNISDASGNFASVRELSDTLALIRRIAPTIPGEAAVGALTAIDRDRAVELRTRLLEHFENRGNLAAIQESFCAVALTDGHYSKSFAHEILMGSTANRFYDKSPQIIAGPNGEIAMNLQGTECDVDFWIYALEQIIGEKEDLDYVGRGGATQISIRHLPFYVDSPLGGGLYNAVMSNQMIAYNFQVESMDIPLPEAAPGDGEPDDPELYVPLACLAAHYRLTGQIASLKQLIRGRHQYQGRNLPVRPVTLPAVAFIRALAGGTDAAGLRELLGPAKEKYGELRTRARENGTVDDHLYALERMVELLSHSKPDIAIPHIYSIDAWQKSIQDDIVLAGIASPQVKRYLRIPEQEDGLAVAYAIRDAALHITASSFTQGGVAPVDFLDTLRVLLASLFQALKG